MGEPSVDPNMASMPASGGSSSHTISNPTESRMAFKVKTSDNALYKVNPVFGFVEPGSQASVEVTRSDGPAKDDKLIIQLAPTTPECADPKVKTSDNALYKVNPVFGFVEPGSQASVEVTRSDGPAKDDKLIIQLAPTTPECADPKEPFSAGGTFPELPVALSAA